MLKLLSSGLVLILLCLLTAWHLSNKFCPPDLLSNLPSLEGKMPAVNANINIGGSSNSLPHFSYSDNKISIPDAEGFGFEKSSDKLVESKTADAYWQAIASSIIQNKGGRLYLQGSYAASETNPTKYGNLGIARAEAIKNKLIAMGAPAAAIITSGHKTGGAFFAGNTYIGGVNFFTETPKNTPTSIGQNTPQDIKGLLIQPLNLYFGTNEREIKMTPQIKAYFDELKVYLAKNPTAKVSVLGFTDNQGDSLKNVALSANRAEMVKDFMVSKKFDTAKLVVRGKGPLRPIGNNETDAGRAQNRRVEVRLMYN